MNNTSRPSPAGPTYFFTLSIDRIDRTNLIDHFGVLSSAIEETQRSMPFYCDAWVAMPDHMHAVWTLPAGDNGYAMRWGQIKRRFTLGLPKMSRPVGSVWKRGVQVQQITGLKEYSDAVRRCWFEPVQLGLAKIPEDWAHSSVHLEDEKTRLVA